MMLAKINRFFFKSQYSMFDVLWLTVMSILAVDYSYWWFLLIIPFSIVSGVMAAFVEVKDERE